MSSPARPLRHRGKGHPPPGISSLRQRQAILQAIAAHGVWIQAVHGADEQPVLGNPVWTVQGWRPPRPQSIFAPPCDGGASA